MNRIGVHRIGRATIAMAAGLAAIAVSGYAFLGITGRVFGPAEVAPLSVLWAVSNAVGAGLFVPVEQELARRVAARRALGLETATVLRPMVVVTAGLLAVLALVALVAAGPLSALLFGGRAGLVGCLVAVCAGFAVQHVTRGLMAGHDQFSRYGAQLAIDGLLRTAGAAALAVAGVRSVVAYGVVLAVAPVVSMLVTVRRSVPVGGETSLWTSESTRDVIRPLALVLVAQVLGTAVIGAGPVAATLLAGPGEATAAGVLIGVLLVARAPLLGFYAVQATMLPGLARMVAVADWAAVRGRLVRYAVVVGAAGAVATLAALVIGPAVVRLLLGPGFDATGGSVALVVAAMFTYIAAATAAQALLAVQGHIWSALAWTAGAGTGALLLLRPDDVSTRVGVAFLGAGLCTLAFAVHPLSGAVRRGLRPAAPAGPLGTARRRPEVKTQS